MTDIPESALMNDASPAVVLRHLSTGFWISQALAVTAALGIADHLQAWCQELCRAGASHGGPCRGPISTLTWDGERWRLCRG